MHLKILLYFLPKKGLKLTKNTNIAKTYEKNTREESYTITCSARTKFNTKLKPKTQKVYQKYNLKVKNHLSV